MKLSPFVLGAAMLTGWALADPTWPNQVDELEDIMYLLTGVNNRGFAVPVTPCSAPGFGRTAAAEWLRTMFHDMASCDIYTGSGGLDGSLMYETTYAENIGSSFPNTFATLAPYYTTRSSVSDLLAVATYVSVRACGGPVVSIRAGRVDATESGPVGFVPQPQNPLGTFQGQFLRMGFNNSDMIAMTACGHTFGGVHAANFPQIVPPGSAPNDYVFCDDTGAVFDNHIATEFIGGTVVDPMSVGVSVKNGQDSDLVVFESDGNATMRTLTNVDSWNSICADVLSRMTEAVPAGTILTDPIVPYEVKPSGLQLTLLSGGTLISFTGSIRVRTTARGISGVSLTYKDRSGATRGTISATDAGTAKGFDDSFEFYSFSANIDSSSSISSFVVTLSVTSGGTEVHDNDGQGYPVQDKIMFLAPNSCINPNPDTNGNQQMTVLTAVRSSSDTGTVSLNLTLPVNRPYAVAVPLLQPLTVAMNKRYTGLGPYNVYTTTYNIAFSQVSTARFDVVGGGSSDTFKQVSKLAGQCAPVGLSPPSSTSSTSTASSTRSSSSTSSSPAAATGWNFLGCYTDSVGARTFANNLGIPNGPGDMTPEQCQTAGKAAGYLYCGVEYGQECWCDNILNNGGEPAPDGNTGCNMPCSGNNNEICGGANRLDVYHYGIISTTSSVSSSFISATTSSSSSSVSTSLSTSSSIVSTISTTLTTTSSSTSSSATPGWNALGCYTDSVAARSLASIGYISGGPAAMTIELCQTACQASGYILAGVEYSQECYCDNQLENGGGPAPDGNTGCNMACSGDPAEICGGPNRLNLFFFKVGGNSITPTTTGVTSTASASTSTTSSSAPMASGWNYLGCYIDSVAARSLQNVGYIAGGPGAMTNPLCQAACESEGYTLAGTEYSDECYCGNALENGGSPAPDGEALCDMTCNGDTTQICGGPNRLTLYSFGPISSSKVVSSSSNDPSSSTSSSSTTLVTSTIKTSSSTISSASALASASSIPGWSKLGCYTDNVAARTLGFSGIVAGSPQSMTIELCLMACTSQGFILAGVEYSGECYCDNSLQNGGGPAPDGDTGCDMTCYGNAGEICGGPNRLDLYQYGSASSAASTSSVTSSDPPTVSPSPSSSTSFITSTTVASSFTTDVPTSIASTAWSSSYTSPSAASSSDSLFATSSTISYAASLTIPTSISSTSSTTSSTTSSASYGPTVGAYTPIGCYTDNPGSRTFNLANADTDNMSLELCASFCGGDLYFGVEYGDQCYCGSALDTAVALQLPSTSCYYSCIGSSTQTCGGANALNVYSLTNPSATSAVIVPTGTPVIKQTVGTYTYYGCMTEATNSRALTDAAASANEMTLELCEGLCSGFKYFGTEFGRECYCGGGFASGSVAVPDGNCSSSCVGDNTEFCGGPSRLSVYVDG